MLEFSEHPISNYVVQSFLQHMSKRLVYTITKATVVTVV